MEPKTSKGRSRPHILLHPYNETSWYDQVLRESLALRVARATVHVHDTLLAGVTSLRDLGTEGAGYSDVGIKQPVEQGTRSHLGGTLRSRARRRCRRAHPGHARLDREGCRLGQGLRDYRWRPEGEAEPTFTLSELERIVEVVQSSGRPVSAHASTAEGMRRAIQLHSTFPSRGNL